MKDPSETTAVDTFIDAYWNRQKLIESAEGLSPELATAILDNVPDVTDSLSTLACNNEVQLFFEDIRPSAGSIAVGATIEVRECDEDATSDQEKIDPYTVMVQEFYIGTDDDTNSNWSSRRFATDRQIDFAKKLDIDVSKITAKSRAGYLITCEVKRRSKAILKNGDLNPQDYPIVLHPRHGECEVEKVNPETGKVTLRPIDNVDGKKARAFAIDAFHVDEYERVTN